MTEIESMSEELKSGISRELEQVCKLVANLQNRLEGHPSTEMALTNLYGRAMCLSLAVSQGRTRLLDRLAVDTDREELFSLSADLHRS